MKRFLYCMITALLLVLLTACSEQDVSVAESSRIYYTNLSETKLVSEGYEPQGTSTEELVEEFITCLSAVPANASYKKLLPDDVLLTDFSIGVDRQLTLYFNEGYLNLTGVTEILCRAAIVKTMCQIDGIDFVEFYVNGQPLMKTVDQPIGWMSAGDFIDNTGAETYYLQDAYICVYYANETGDALKEAQLHIEFAGTRTQEQLVLGQLIAGPISELEDMQATLPEGTAVNKVVTQDGICYVDFNSSFLNKRSTVTEEVTIYSVVNSLVELSNVNQVQITVDGEVRRVYQSIDISLMLDRKLELIEE